MVGSRSGDRGFVSLVNGGISLGEPTESGITEDDKFIALAGGFMTSFLASFGKTTIGGSLMKDVPGLAVHPSGHQNNTSADREGESEREIEEGNGSETRDDNAQTRGEAFEDVVGVFDHQRRDETTKDLNEDGCPCPPPKVTEQAQPVFAPREFVNGRKGGGNNRKERELGIPYPQVRLGVFQYHLEVHASQPGGAASDQNGQEPGGGIHQTGCTLPPNASHTLHLHDPNAQS